MVKCLGCTRPLDEDRPRWFRIVRKGFAPAGPYCDRCRCAMTWHSRWLRKEAPAPAPLPSQ